MPGGNDDWKCVCSPADERRTAVVMKKLPCHSTGLQHQKRRCSHIEPEELGLCRCFTNEETEALFKKKKGCPMRAPGSDEGIASCNNPKISSKNCKSGHKII